MAGVVYGVIEPRVGYGSDAASGAVVGGLFLLQLLAGAAANRRRAVLLPFAAIALAFPAGYPDDPARGEPLPTWLGFVLFAPFWTALVAIGIGTRRLAAHRRS